MKTHRKIEDPDMNPHNYAYLIIDKTYDGKKTASSTNVQGKLDVCLQKTKTRSMSFTLYEYQLKVDQGYEYKT
jgi:hypothetical protein